AADVAGNVESAPDVADAACGFSIPAAVDIDPDTLNLKGNGRWVTAYIELPQGYDFGNVGIPAIMLNDAVPAESSPTYGFVKDPQLVDRDADGLPELMVKFDRAAVQALASVGDVKLTVTGKWHAVLFEGSDNIRVIDPGQGNGGGQNHGNIPESPPGHSVSHPAQGHSPPSTPPGQGGTPPGQSSDQSQGNGGEQGNQGNQNSQGNQDGGQGQSSQSQEHGNEQSHSSQEQGNGGGQGNAGGNQGQGNSNKKNEAQGE
ncbi:MAG: hypothetical protein AB1476_02980, partial [Candidatus Hadarchaeota archaeon]